MIDKLGVKISALEQLTGNTEWCYSPEGEEVDNSDFYVQYVSYPDGYNGLMPTQDEVENKANELWDSFIRKQYQRDRVYPSLEEQADMAYWDRKNGTTTLDDALDAVKAAYPKPTE